jgi:raffinose/stachyose/melibiose transport system substrate-binding protein
MKKIVVFLTAFCLLAGILAGCSSKGSSTTTKQKVTITYMASQDWVKPGETALAKKFETQTGIHVDFQIVPFAQYNNMLSAKLSSGEATDIYGNNTDPFTLDSNFHVTQNAVDLSKQSWAKTEDSLVKAGATVKGKLYGLTLYDVSAEWVVNYNKTIFAKYKLNVPKTFAQFESDCQTLKDNGITPIYECVSDGWHQVLWFPELGGAIGDSESGLVDKLNNNQTKFADIPAATTDLNEIQDMIKKGYWGTDYMSNTYADSAKNMASGKYAMTINNFALPSSIATQYSNVKESDFGFFPNPVLDNQYQNLNPVGPTKFIWSGSKHKTEAEEYLNFLTQKDNLQSLIDNSSDQFMTLPFPSIGLKTRYSDEANAYFNTYTKKETVLQTSLKYVNANWTDIGKDMSAMFVGSETSNQVLGHLDEMRTQAATAAKDSAWSK